MDYLYENLGPERFQQFAQSLVIREFSGVQCFPVAQPDGGRDVIAYYPARNTGEFIVFQVKFVRKPQAEQDPHVWLTEIMKDEAPKVEKLIQRGAQRYVLITNIPGTAHLDTGSIDKINSILDQALSIPTECWWRDDLNRRLDNAWELKWTYPDLMSGPDMLRSLIETGLSDDKDRRISAIRAFLRNQYELDQEVRFKQIELQNNLFDLFIDVPVDLTINPANHKKRHLYFHIMQSLAQQDLFIDPIEGEASDRASYTLQKHLFFRNEEHYIGTAKLLLHPTVQEYIPQIVLEGAPGQGKSTLTQYVCQIHRMRILGKKDLFRNVGDLNKFTGVRIPFRVDLRDLAAWLGKQDPFSADENSEPPAGWHKSLEAFLAAQVKHYSGGVDFSVADLHAIAKISALLVVLDGLDEVADISKRQEIVNEVTLGVARLRENAASLQVVVTSRPAAFANSPGFPESNFPHLSLTSITRPLIDEYTNKWLRARKLNSRESADVKKILKEKLDQPHLRDLARNPMQLAILLSLIHTRGSSLPDMRTALYDNYIDLFFNREAEKSPIVREHRNLLIDIHRFLAWFLHTQAEEGNNRGSISTEKLQRLLSEYLTKEEQDVLLAETLFSGMVERVVALVSRVQGTYEFEVQPLREYFAARFLYETAPYSPPGSERRGTKPDRFDAIAQNFYWLNVTRFYSGCFSKGELPSLVDRLQELSQTEGFRHTSHPRDLAAMLLTDGVFAQHPKSMQQVVSLILDDLGLRLVANSRSQRNRTIGSLALSKQSGKDILINRCFDVLRRQPPRDYARDIMILIKENCSPREVKEQWLQQTLGVEGAERTRWIIDGLFLGTLSEANKTELEQLLSDDPLHSGRLNTIFRARHVEFCEDSTERSDIIAHSALRGMFRVHGMQRIPSILAIFSQVLNPLVYAAAFQHPEPIPLAEAWRRGNQRPVEALDQKVVDLRASNETLKRCVEVIRVAEQEHLRTSQEWSSELAPWDSLIEKSRSVWGEWWVHYDIANIASGIRNPKETCIDSPDLLDSTKSLCRRTRYARLRAGSVEWWQRQIETASTELGYMHIALVLLTWASPRTITSLVEVLDPIINQLSHANWQRLMDSVENALTATRGPTRENRVTFDVSALPEEISERLAAAIGLRAKHAQALEIYQKYLNNYQGTDIFVLEFCLRSELQLVQSNPQRWQQTLLVIEKAYSQGITADLSGFQSFTRPTNTKLLPLELARQIVEQPQKYPRYLVAFAETRCRQDLTRKIVPVGKVAQKEEWFD